MRFLIAWMSQLKFEIIEPGSAFWGGCTLESQLRNRAQWWIPGEGSGTWNLSWALQLVWSEVVDLKD